MLPFATFETIKRLEFVKWPSFVAGDFAIYIIPMDEGGNRDKASPLVTCRGTRIQLNKVSGSFSDLMAFTYEAWVTDYHTEVYVYNFDCSKAYMPGQIEVNGKMLDGVTGFTLMM